MNDFWTLGVSRTASYEIIIVRLSVCLSVCPSATKFSETGSSLFSDIAHGDSWPWYVVTDKVRFSKKKIYCFSPVLLDRSWKMLYWFICCPQRHGYFSLVESLLVKLYTDYICYILIYRRILIEIIHQPFNMFPHRYHLSANLPCREVTNDHVGSGSK